MDQINTIAKTTLLDFKNIENSNNDTLEKIQLHTNFINTNKTQCANIIVKSLEQGNYQESLNAMINLCWLSGLDLNSMISIAVSEFKMSESIQHYPSFTSPELPTSMQNTGFELYENYSVCSTDLKDFVINYLKSQESNKFSATYEDICDAFEKKHGADFTQYEMQSNHGEKSPRWKRRISNLSKGWEKENYITRPKRGVYKLSQKLILEIYK